MFRWTRKRQHGQPFRKFLSQNQNVFLTSEKKQIGFVQEAFHINNVLLDT